MTIANQTLIRTLNRKKVLETILVHPSISRANITALTGLTGGTITSIVQQLLDEQLLEEVGTATGGKGRRGLLLQINAKAASVLSVTMGKDQLRLMQCDLGGTALEQAFQEVSYEKEELFLQTLLQFVAPFLHSGCPFGTGAVVLAVEGAMEDDQITLQTLTFSKETLKETLQQAWQVPVFLEHVSRLSPLGENAYAMKCQNMAYLHAENTLGLGLIVDGKLFCGGHGQACQVGALRLWPHQTFAQKAALPLLLQKNGFADFLAFAQAFAQREERALATAEQFLDFYGLLLENIFLLYDPQRLVIHCPFTSMGDELFLRLKKRLGPFQNRLYRSFLQSAAPLCGGTVLGICQFLGIDTFVPAKSYGVLSL